MVGMRMREGWEQILILLKNPHFSRAAFAGEKNRNFFSLHDSIWRVCSQHPL